MKAAPDAATVAQAESTYEQHRVRMIYEGSDGEATQALYMELAGYGPIGTVAIHLFRAQKCSARAKLYSSGHYASLAYGRKQWSLDQLAALLTRDACGLRFGWGTDPESPRIPWVFYVDLPTGQVSFHAPVKGEGPLYPGVWDGAVDASTDRVIAYVDALLHPIIPRVAEVPDDQAPTARGRTTRPGPARRKRRRRAGARARRP